jgi:hypothetical protein
MMFAIPKLLKISMQLTLVSILLSCVTNDPIRKRILLKDNPTELVFPLSKDSLRTAVINIFNSNAEIRSKFYNNSIFYLTTNDGEKVPIAFRAEGIENSIFTEVYFTNNPNSEEVYLYNSSGSSWLSPVYYVDDNKALPFRSSFIVAFDSLETNKTRLKVTAENPVVIYGTECCDPHGYYGKEVAIPPTTIEEYSLILFIAEQLAVSAPALIMEFKGGQER